MSDDDIGNDMSTIDDFCGVCPVCAGPLEWSHDEAGFVCCHRAFRRKTHAKHGPTTERTI